MPLSHAHHALLLTPGEPAGIGPELTVRAAMRRQRFPLVAICDPYLLESTAQALGLSLKLCVLDKAAVPASTLAGEINVIPVALARPSQAGQLDTCNAAYVIETLQTANDLCMSGKYAAVVTGPVQKSIINDAGIAFSGHTEFFAQQSHTAKVVMMLATQGLRVALATTHIPLKEVSAAISQASLSEVLTILIDQMHTTFGLLRPRILVAGLNPHAGEGGHLGHEEIDTIIPVLNRLSSDGVELVGPLPADTLFTPKYLRDADCVLAMYHDQGLPVLKHMGFGKAVNITLGLPYIRTSVDHGTALDLAGKGCADEGSMTEAISIAADLLQRQLA